MKNVLGLDDGVFPFFFRFLIPLMGKTRNMDGMMDRAVRSIYLHRILTHWTGFEVAGRCWFLWIWGWEVMKMNQCERSELLMCFVGRDM